MWLGVFIYLRNPVLPSFGSADRVAVSKENLERHVRFLSEMSPPRSYRNPFSMRAAENYIRKELESYGYEVMLQEVNSYKETYHNVIARYGDKDAKELIVVGAHYDVVDDKVSPGADDNASGVAGLLEVARLLKAQKRELPSAIELVAYTLEEPPFFGDHSMGSAYHADQLKLDGFTVKLMIAIEMIGYYSDSWFSQKFPIGLLYGFYPWTGNFISIVASPMEREVVREFKSAMSAGASVPVYSINAPSMVEGVDFSDHRSYWAHDWPALMITDTSFYRNTEYHKSGDTADRLDYLKMADVVGGVLGAIKKSAELK